MNSNEDWGNRGANIKPSARPSIHNHEFCIFADSARSSMGRFGVDDRDGVDEVDNVMSKPSQPISPRFEKLGNKQSKTVQNSSLRRNSLNNENRNYTDEDLLSKSAPATFPSQLHYSDVSDDEPASAHDRHFNESFHSINTSPVSRNRSASNVSLSNESIREFTQIKSNQSMKVVLPLISLVVLFGSVYMKLITYEDNTVVYDEFMFYNDIINLGHKYEVDENEVLKVQTGISTIFKRQDAGSFMFVYNSNTEGFDRNAFNRFINEISFTTSKYLRNDSIPLNYIDIEGKDLDMEEHSEVMCKFRDDLHKSGVMLVKDIQAIPSSLAMAFHYFCDEYNPLVKKSAIFFTIDLAKCLPKEPKSAKYIVVENCLANKWNSISPDSIGPLLTRVVNIIVDVTEFFFSLKRDYFWSRLKKP